jgi:hypothetical protein
MTDDINVDELDDLFDEDNEVESNWFSFDEVGDKIAGTLKEKDYQECDEFPDQHVYRLETPDGQVVNVGISVSKEGTIQRAEQAAIGDTLGFEFHEEKEPSNPAYDPYKLIKVYVRHNEDSTDEENADEFDDIGA